VELAASGTLFLDEVGELTPLLQVKLLKVVEGLAYKRLGGSSWLCATARVIAATQRLAGPGAGTLRPDLYHRLASIRINLPPLRARPEDIAPLASRLLRRTFPERRLELATDALDALARHHWPGNVRELHHVLLRAVQRTEGRDLLRAEHVVLNEDAPAWTAGDHDARARHARAVLDQVGGVRRRAAEVLGIDEKTLRKLLREGGEPDA
jgi:transcriptional regulator with PAS, ATPase and Fis domain